MKRRFLNSKSTYPVPRCAKLISKFADKKCEASGLQELPEECGGGAEFDPEKIVMQLVAALEAPPMGAVNIQILGDGFRAMRSTSIVSVGVRLLIETEEEAGDTSFSAIASL